jgi:outer membrane protein assembly factor BamB
MPVGAISRQPALLSDDPALSPATGYNMAARLVPVPATLLLLLGATCADTPPDESEKKYPLGPQLRVLAADVNSLKYRKLVTDKMLLTDLGAEWQRVATADNADSFLAAHGGKDKVLADPVLKRAYLRRVAIRDQFLDLMREGYRRYKQVPPFDRGEKAEAAGTVVREALGRRLPLEVVLPAPRSERHWPRFRGASGQGLTGARDLPIRWDKDGTNLRWRAKVPGRGNSSPAIWGERLFLTSAAADGTGRAVLCFRTTDSKLLWSRRAPAAPPEAEVRDKNGYASATPVTDGERVIAFLGSCGLVCYDLQGTLLWRHDRLRIHTTHGTGSSPLLYKDKVILIQDQNLSDSIFLALDKRTGKLLWQQPRPRAMTWSTPVVVRVAGHDELLFAGAGTVKGYDPDTGRELWSLSGPTVEVVPALVVGKDMVYSASGRNGPTLGLRLGGHGDVTKTHLVWRTVRAGPHVPSPLYLDGRLYTVNDTGVATCLDALTGRLLWQERIPDRFSASPIEGGGLIYVPAESGVTYVLRAGDRFELVAQNDLGAPILASPAVVGNRIFLRTEEALVCVEAAAVP